LDDQSGNGALDVVPTLGGQSRVVVAGSIYTPALSPDGRYAAYFDKGAGEFHLTVVPVDGGTPHVLDKWSNTQALALALNCTWTADSRHLLVRGSKRRGAPNLDEWEWFALPVDGGDPVPTGAGEAIRAAGLGLTWSGAIVGDRVLFFGVGNQRHNVWEIRLTPGSWRVAGPPRQLTFGTEKELPTSVSAAGTAAIQIFRDSNDLYLLPIDPDTGHAAGLARRLTQDGRNKLLFVFSGDPGFAYFVVRDFSGRGPVNTLFSLDLASSRQIALYRNLPLGAFMTILLDGRQVAYSRPDGDGYAISVGAVGAPPEDARALCQGCGRAEVFSPDGRYLLSSREARAKPNPKQNYSIARIEVASGRLVPWLEDPAESVEVRGFLMREWVVIDAQRPGEENVTQRGWLVPWRPEPVPRSEWIEFQPPGKTWDHSPVAPFIYGLQESRLMATKFDAKQRRMSEPFPVRLAPDSPVEIRPTDNWFVRGPGIVFERRQTSGSVWLMKLPE